MLRYIDDSAGQFGGLQLAYDQMAVNRQQADRQAYAQAEAQRASNILQAASFADAQARQQAAYDMSRAQQAEARAQRAQDIALNLAGNRQAQANFERTEKRLSLNPAVEQRKLAAEDKKMDTVFNAAMLLAQDGAFENEADVTRQFGGLTPEMRAAVLTQNRIVRKQIEQQFARAEAVAKALRNLPEEEARMAKMEKDFPRIRAVVAAGGPPEGVKRGRFRQALRADEVPRDYRQAMQWAEDFKELQQRVNAAKQLKETVGRSRTEQGELMPGQQGWEAAGRPSWLPQPAPVLPPATQNIPAPTAPVGPPGSSRNNPLPPPTNMDQFRRLPVGVWLIDPITGLPVQKMRDAR